MDDQPNDAPRSGAEPDRPAGSARRQPDLGTAQLAQYGAVVVIIVGIALLILGYQHVIAVWLSLLLGIPVVVAGGALLVKAYGWESDAVRARSPKPGPDDDSPATD
jgi:hypothetical protein